MDHPTVQRAVILAAGMGTRLDCADRGCPKPLVMLGERPLLHWILSAVARAGIPRATVVTGWRGAMLADYVNAQPVPGLSCDTIPNDEWKKKNGVSLLKAAPVVAEPFLLMMADHIFEDGLLRGLAAVTPPPDGVVLAVDRRLDTIFDMDDATKVATVPAGTGGAPGLARIVAIDKGLETFDAVDCGLFLCTTAIFRALSDALVDGDCSLSDGMRRLAAQGRFLAHDIGAAFWQDVDTPEMFAYATENLHRLA